MPFAWSIARVLFRLVAPSLPDVVSTIATLKTQQTASQVREEPFDARVMELERTLIQQLELIEKLTRQVDTLQAILRRTLIISLVALLLSLAGLALFLYG